MMENEYKWVNASCYFPMDKWCLLLLEIENFYTAIRSSGGLVINVAFNHDNGNNIRLSILSRNLDFKEIMRKVDNYFHSFFLNFPDESIKSPIKSIHLPFPTCIVRFNIFEASYEEHMQANYKIQELISNFTIVVLQRYEIDSDTITTFFSYLQIALLKKCLNNIELCNQRY